MIPSYWGRRSGEPFHPEDAVYDHPTCLDMPGTLARALESVRTLEYDNFRVMVIGVATHPSLEDEVERRLAEIVTPFKKDLPIAYLSHSGERFIHRVMGEEGMASCIDLVSLRGYSPVRNTCLVAAVLTGAEAAVLFDDDEVYEDPLYLSRVEEHIGKEFRGSFVGGLAGYYVNPDGGYMIREPEEWVWAEWPAATEMNLAFRIIEGDERLQPTTWVFGGNMVVHRRIFQLLPFDPHVPRGEDIDYLINARFFGYDFFLDNCLWIRHLPPPKTSPLWRRFREDVVRFVYTREKLRAQEEADLPSGMRRVRVEELDPYPGRFLREDLEEMIYRTSVLMGMYYLDGQDREGFEESMRNIQIARRMVPLGYDPFRWYLAFQRRWEIFMEWLSSCGRLVEYFDGLYE